MATCNEAPMKIDGQTVYFASSESMTGLESGSIDIIVTSPPYNRNKHYSSDTNETCDDSLPECQYLEFLERTWRECLRVASEKAVFFLNVGDSASGQGISEKVCTSAEKAGWHRVQDIAWRKSIHGRGHYTPTGSNKRFNNVWEHVFMLVKDEKKYRIDPLAIGIPYADRSNVGRYGESDVRDPGNAWHIVYDVTTGATVKKGHAAPFPIGLPLACIKVVPGARTVLDPFLGTGTTLAAAENLGLVGFGYEKFPRKDLIRDTVLAGRDYKQKQMPLIPHLEASIGALLGMIAVNKFDVPSIKSKKERDEFLVLKETIEKLDLETPLVEEIEKRLASFEGRKVRDSRSRGTVARL